MSFSAHTVHRGAGTEAAFTLKADVLSVIARHTPPMGYRRRIRRQAQQQLERDDDWLVPSVAFVLFFGGMTYVPTPEAPGKALRQAEWKKRTTDQGYGSCSDAKRRGHQNIGSWEPSYRPDMDRDGDGLACEPYA